MIIGKLRLTHYVEGVICNNSVVAFMSHGLMSPGDTEPIYELPLSLLQLNTSL